MEKNQPFFDPYNFNVAPQMPQMPYMQPDITPGMENAMSPTMYYEQQYIYYKYLTQVLEYKMKLKEYEKTNRDTPNK